MAINHKPSLGCVLENILLNGDNCLPGSTVVERSEGEFLVLDRWFSHSSSDQDGSNLTLVYGVQRRLTSSEFYSLLGMRDTGPCTADDISDHLVKAFDCGVAESLGLDSALFAYRAQDGRIMHQHST